MDKNLKEEEEDHEKKKKKKEKKVPFMKLFAFSDLLDYMLMGLGSVGACAHGASLPIFFMFFGKLINALLMVYLYPSSNASHQVAMCALNFLYLGIVVLFVSWIEVACWIYTGERQVAKMRMTYLKSVLNQDLSFFDNESSAADVTNTIGNDLIVIQDAISEKVGNFMHCTARSITGCAIGFAHVWQISLLTLSVIPLIAVFAGIYAYALTGFLSRVRKSYVRAGEITEEALRDVRTVQAFVAEEKVVKSYKVALLKSYKFGIIAELAKGLGLGSLNFVLFCSLAMLIWFTSIIVHKGIASGGESFTTMLNVIISGVALGQAAPNISAFIQAKYAGYRIFKVIEKKRDNKTNSNTSRTLEIVEGHIKFKDVCFSYPSRPDVMIFNNLCLDIPSKKRVALVGASGSGKSTIISLIERFYEPLSGMVLLDGNDIRELKVKWLRQQIGLVNQEPALFATSIRENLLYSKGDATVEEITNAIYLSGAVSFINNLPEGYETQVGERGIQLSGGQKQRIAIARAILKNPSIVLLDEATSALDVESEKSIQEALDRAMEGRTTIIVAHRLSTIQNADIIAIVQDGRIVQTGSHQELMSNPNNVYASLVELQENASSSNHHLLMGSTTGDIPSIKQQEQLSCASMSFGASFHSDDDSIRHYSNTKGVVSTKPNHVSMRRLYATGASDWIYGLFGTLGAIVVGAEMPLGALGITEALVAYYMDWETMSREVKKIALFFCGGSILSVIFHTMKHLSFGIMGERLTLRVREMVFAAILRNEIGWFDEECNNSLILSSQLEADVTLLRKIVVDHSTILIQNTSLFITSFIIAFILNWRIMLIVLATYPLLIIGNISEILFMQGYTHNLYKSYLKANMIASEAVSNIRTVIAFCSEEKVMARFAHELAMPSRAFFRRGQIAGIFYGVAQFFVFSSYGLILWYGSVLMRKEVASFNSVLKTFMVLIITAFKMADTLASAPFLIKAKSMLGSLFGLIDRTSEVPGDVGDEVKSVEGTIEFKNIKFSYPSRSNVLVFKNFNMKAFAGKSVALVGSSGSGKSSVLSLILRFYDPISGQVMIDGKDIKKLKLKSLRKHIGLVEQEPSLFATTIYENILFGKDCALESEVIEAAKLANAHTFISSLPYGYSTKVGDQGVQLSGGQKQRIAIARAVLKNPTILLLDEATSALDAESEHLVQQALDRLMKGRTTIMVAHRLSSIQNADQILVLEDGTIVEEGSHSTLLKNINGPYYRLFKLQQQQQQQQQEE